MWQLWIFISEMLSIINKVIQKLLRIQYLRICIIYILGTQATPDSSKNFRVAPKFLKGLQQGNLYSMYICDWIMKGVLYT